MAHYAFLDDNNIVTEVIVGRNEDEVVDGISDWETYYGELRGQRCVRTSYNNNIRKNFAGVGYTYNESADVFVSAQPYPSWTLNEVEWLWESPVPQPATVPDGTHIFDDGNAAGSWVWDESTVDWVWIDYGN
jgi:hypothetical protein